MVNKPRTIRLTYPRIENIVLINEIPNTIILYAVCKKLKGFYMKRIVSVIILCALALCGCTKPADAPPAANDGDASKASYKIHRCVGFTGYNFCFPAANSEYGAYISAGIAKPLEDTDGEEVSPIQEERTLLYIDFEAKTIAPLKNNELTTADLWSYFLCDGEYLYGIHYGYDGQDVFPQDDRDYIFRTNLNGKDRAELVLPSDYEFVDNCTVAYSDGELLFTAENESGCSILSADFNDMTVSHIYIFPETDYSWNIEDATPEAFIIGTFDDISGVGVRYYSLNLTTDEFMDIDYAPVPQSDEIGVSSVEVGDIVARTEKDYLVFTGYEAADSSIYLFNENVFPSFGLISKESYETGNRNCEEIEKLF